MDPYDRAMNGAQFAHLWGRGMDAWPEDSAPTRSTPWKSAGRSKVVKDYDQGVVDNALSKPPVLRSIDPRVLRSMQPAVTRQGVSYYMENDYQQTGQTFADRDKVGNKFPFVYKRTDGAKTEYLLLAGNHRATADLMAGRMTQAIVEEGPWGPPRK